jgi:hypothetical protein
VGRGRKKKEKNSENLDDSWGQYTAVNKNSSIIDACRKVRAFSNVEKYLKYVKSFF